MHQKLEVPGCTLNMELTKKYWAPKEYISCAWKPRTLLPEINPNIPVSSNWANAAYQKSHWRPLPHCMHLEQLAIVQQVYFPPTILPIGLEMIIKNCPIITTAIAA